MPTDLLSLQEMQKNSIFSLSDTSALGKQILMGISFLHNNNVIHTDLKPDNILVNNKSPWKIQITDLGTAVVENERTNDYIQTMHYRSPEIIMQYKSWNNKIDIWSCACIFFEMLTSDFLFDGDSEEDMILCMVEVLGIPTKDFISSCKAKHIFFNRDNKLKQRADLHPLPLDRLLHEEYNFSTSDSYAICKLLKPMLNFSPDSRFTADQLLELYP
jgi:serine/threonine protein kinase